MRITRRVLSVFLASPSDVVEERVAAERVVASVNATLGRNLGWQIDLHRWEDKSPAFGRPQDLINPMIEDCDLFIGLVWQRWGTPSGGYSSGFQEEYELAKYLRTTSGKPEIWIVFKKITPRRLKSPDEQLRKVLEFRELQTALNEAIFKQVNNANDWELKLSLWLSEYIVNLADTAKDQQLGQESPNKPVQTNAEPSSSFPTKEVRKAAEGLYSKFQSLIAKSNDFEVLRILNESQLALGEFLSAGDFYSLSRNDLTHRKMQLCMRRTATVLRKTQQTLPQLIPDSILLLPAMAGINKLLSLIPEEPKAFTRAAILDLP